jgi:hypothetical protein
MEIPFQPSHLRSRPKKEEEARAKENLAAVSTPFKELFQTPHLI